MNHQTITSDPIERSQDPARRERALAELASEQGFCGPQLFDAICGAGADLWDDDAEFEQFQAGLAESRRTGG